MSKKKLKYKIGVFIGLSAAHRILAKISRKKESIIRLQQEADSYRDLSEDVVGNWNASDILDIKEIAKERCRKKLQRYPDLGNEKYAPIETYIKEIMKNLGLL